MTTRNFENARKIAREAVFAHARLNGRGGAIDDSDRAIGIKWMSNLLWEVPSWEGGLMGLSDAAFDAFCEENSQYVSRAIARNAQWTRDVAWPRDAEDEAELACWREAYARNLAFRAAHADAAEHAAAPDRIAKAAGWFEDSNQTDHGSIRAADGTFTPYDPESSVFTKVDRDQQQGRDPRILSK